MFLGKQTPTFVSWVVFSRVGFKQIISSGKLKSLRKKTPQTYELNKWMGLIKYKSISEPCEFVAIVSQCFIYLRVQVQQPSLIAHLTLCVYTHILTTTSVAVDQCFDDHVHRFSVSHAYWCTDWLYFSWPISDFLKVWPADSNFLSF